MAKRFQLPDGRNLDYAVYGPADGFPFIWIHGTPGGYIPVPDILNASEKKGLRIIAASRAGYGDSTRNKGRKIVDAVADLHALNEHLGVKQCLVGGWSGGGPHALACAARLPGCVGALSVAGVAPYDAEGLDYLAGQGEDNINETKAALEGVDVMEKYCEEQRGGMIEADIAGIIEAISSLLPEVDRKALLESTDLGQHMVELTREGLKNTAHGWVDDNMAFVKPWGFELSDIKVPVILYQGSDDKMVPFAHGQWIAAHLPQDKLVKHLIQGQGHISIFIGQADTIVDELVKAAGVKV